MNSNTIHIISSGNDHIRTSEATCLDKVPLFLEMELRTDHKKQRYMLKQQNRLFV